MIFYQWLLRHRQDIDRKSSNFVNHKNFWLCHHRFSIVHFLSAHRTTPIRICRICIQFPLHDAKGHAQTVQLVLESHRPENTGGTELESHHLGETVNWCKFEIILSLSQKQRKAWISKTLFTIPKIAPPIFNGPKIILAMQLMDKVFQLIWWSFPTTHFYLHHLRTGAQMRILSINQAELSTAQLHYFMHREAAQKFQLWFSLFASLNSLIQTSVYSCLLLPDLLGTMRPGFSR